MEQENKQGSESTVTAQIKAKWAKLSDLDISDAIKDMDTLSTKIQQTYGQRKDDADQAVSEFRKSLAVNAIPANPTVAN